MEKIVLRKYGKAIKLKNGLYIDQYAFNGVAVTYLEHKIVLTINEIIDYIETH